MQATEMAPTHPHAPYDRLHAMRCRYEFQGRLCRGRGADINWNEPGTHAFRCMKCGTQNVVRVVEAGTCDE